MPAFASLPFLRRARPADEVPWRAGAAEPEPDPEREMSARRGRGLSRLSGIRKAGLAIVDLLYPPSCLACGALQGDSGGLCAACWRGLPVIERPFCERLGTPFALDIGGTLVSPPAIADPPVFAHARAVARFDGPSRALVHRLKYGDRLDLAIPMGRWMARAGAELLVDADGIVAVPLHPFRLWRRRFNQAALLAAAVSRSSGIATLQDVLVRRRPTRSQVGLSRAQRAANLQGVFTVPPAMRAAAQGRRLVLVDDVMTTGSTANACARALMRAGAVRVDVLVFAVVAQAP